MLIWLLCSLLCLLVGCDSTDSTGARPDALGDGGVWDSGSRPGLDGAPAPSADAGGLDSEAIDGLGLDPDRRMPDAGAQDGSPESGPLPPDARPPPPVDPTPEPLAAAWPPGRTETLQAGRFTDDFLYGPDERVKVGVRRDWGASIVYFGLGDPALGLNAANTVDASDTGREVQIALYDPLRRAQGCAHDASCDRRGGGCPASITFLGWNPVQGGNRCNNGSALDATLARGGALTASLRPLHWNPDWERPDCASSGCDDPARERLQSQIVYTQRLRFVHSDIVELQMQVHNPTEIDHPPTAQEFPTVYATFGRGSTPDLHRIMDSEGREILIDVPANDGFFSRSFESPGGWVSLQDEGLAYGIGIYYESRLTAFQGWQRRGVFNNVRALYEFGLPAGAMVSARAYLMLGSLDTIRGLAAWLDQTLAPFGVLDAPPAGEPISGVVPVAGWALDNRGVTEVVVSIDERRVTIRPETNRPDVCAAWPGYPDCPRVGFNGALDVTGLSPGRYPLEVEGVDTDGNRRRFARRVVQVR